MGGLVWVRGMGIGGGSGRAVRRGFGRGRVEEGVGEMGTNQGALVCVALGAGDSGLVVVGVVNLPLMVPGNAPGAGAAK